MTEIIVFYTALCLLALILSYLAINSVYIEFKTGGLSYVSYIFCTLALLVWWLALYGYHLIRSSTGA